MTYSADSPDATTAQIRKRLFLLLTTALLTLVLGITLTVSFTLLGSLKEAKSTSLVRIAEIRSMAISEWCRRAKDVARQITSRTRIRQELEKYNAGEIGLKQLNQFSKSKLQDAMRLSNEVRGILRLDAKNRIVTHCGYGSSLSMKPEDLMRYISDNLTIYEPLTIQGNSCLIVSAPILNRDGKRQGTDLVIIGMEQLQTIVTNHNNLGRSSEIILGYASGGSFFSLFPWEEQEGPSAAGSELLHAIRKYMNSAIAGTSGLVHEDGLALAYHSVSECNWGLVITENNNELYSPLYTKLAIISGLTFVIFLVILFGFWSIMKPMAGKILLHADDLEKKIREKTASLKSEIEERKKAEQGKEATIAELREAMVQIKMLSGLLPICANCKKIRDDQGYWNQIESYISKHSEAEFSHGICPECAKKLYPNLKISKP